MKQEPCHQTEPRDVTRARPHRPPGPRFATAILSFLPVMKKGLVSLLGASALLVPSYKAEGATILPTVNSSIFQAGNNVNLTSTVIDYTFKNNAVDAQFNNATLDLNAVLGSVVEKIVAHNPSYTTGSAVYNDMSFSISPAGDVYDGWSSSINTTTGLLSLTNNGGRGYHEWSYPRTMIGTLNLGNMLDFNSNGVIDPDEVLAFSGIANNAFIGYDGAIGFQANVDKITVIPEPSSALIGGLGALALLRRRREPRKD